MSKTVHPYAHRLVVQRGWKSRWFARDSKYKDLLRADIIMREYLQKKLKGFYISSIEIERGRQLLRLIIRTSRPGMIIGRSGEGAIKLKADLLSMLGKQKVSIPEELKIDIVEVSAPDADAAIIAASVVDGLEKRLPFRKILKTTIDKVMTSRNVKGARIKVSGRLNGAEMSRQEEVKKGSIPLQTLRADVDFARDRARLPYGTLGVKVWIYRGEVFDEKDKQT